MRGLRVVWSKAIWSTKQWGRQLVDMSILKQCVSTNCLSTKWSSTKRALSIMTYCIIAISIAVNNTSLHLVLLCWVSFMMGRLFISRLNVVCSHSECRYVKRCYAECPGANRKDIKCIFDKVENDFISASRDSERDGTIQRCRRFDL